MKNVANAYLILALILGSLVPIMLKIASQNINVYEYIMLTTALSLPTALLFVIYRKKTERLVATMRNLKEFAFIAFLGLLFYGMLEYGLVYAESIISTSLATVIYRSFPILMLLFLPIMLRERVSKYQIAAIMLGFAGLYIAVTGGHLAFLGNANAAVVGLVVLIAITSAYVTVAIKKYSFDIEIAMVIFNLALFLFSAALFLAVGAKLQPINTGALLAILYIGIVYNVFISIMYYSALRRIKTTFVTNIYFLSPFLTFVFSWLILGDKIYLYYVVIAVLVSIGLIIQKFDRRGGTYLSKQKGTEKKYTFHDVTSAFINTNAPLIYNAIKSGGRVLAVKVDQEDYESVKKKMGKADNGTLIYTDRNRRFINNEQSEFIKEIMGVKENELILMSAGIPKESESALSDLLSYKN